MYKIYKLENLETNKTYYGKSKLSDRILQNIINNYSYSKDNLLMYEIIKDHNYNLHILNEYDNLDELKKDIKDMIKKDEMCIQRKTDENDKDNNENIEKSKGKKKVSKEKIREYNKRLYNKNKDKAKQYYKDNKDKIREYQKRKYYEIKEKLNSLKNNLNIE